MQVSRQKHIREEARKLLIRLWKRRCELWSTPPDPVSMVQQAPEIIVSKLLGLCLETPEEIGRGPAYGLPPTVEVEIAGYLDRTERKIVIAQKFPLKWRRFTLAHEIGHLILHPEVLLHRIRPLTGGELANPARDPQEREADLFAAEFLMPSKLVRKAFLSAFGKPLDGSRLDADLAFSLSAASGRQIGASDLVRMEPAQRALLVANAGIFGRHSFMPLHETFRVSPTAMAIQLRDLGLVC